MNADAGFVQIKDLAAHDGRDVSIHGWLFGKRSGGGVAFLQIRDGSGICQCVVESSAEDAFKKASELPHESSLIVRGIVRKDERAIGGYEIAVSSVEIIHIAAEYPITRKAHGIDFLMSHRHLWLRSRRPTAILRIRHTLIKACRDFFDNRGFTLVDTPILVAGAGEDAQTLFPVEYFDRKAFLAQTGQLYLESACLALGKVYCFGPTFRAEKSKTRRHLTEFWMIEPEVAFAELDDVIALAEDMVCYVVEQVLARHQDDLTFLGRDIEALRKVKKPFIRMTYGEVAENLRSAKTKDWLEKEMMRDKEKLQALIDELGRLEKQVDAVKKTAQKDKIQIQIHELKENIEDLEADLHNRPAHIASAQAFEFGGDLGGSDETIISKQFDKPVFVTDYPREAKAFYMKESVQDKRLVRNMDLLAPEGYGEIIGGSQREENLDVLVTRMKEKGLNPEDYDWYLDVRKYGSVPHGGFGLGIERALTWICGLKHVRETIPFPRTMGRIYP
ncbi:MAG: asparagine--tRNA ligase [Kiritimatiellae bacterium]|nr:asparagine--tRNA ligase [Kiritimatiellia bacterium]MDD5520369.1 asparagine--tRNA ligase [Kiritimatiellia bacterium]